MRPEWRGAVADERGRVERVSYELCVLRALRDALRRREIWVVGAGRWRNPEADLPHDFDLHRDVHYSAIAQPTDPTEFVASLRTRMDTALAALAEAMRTGAAGSRVTTRKNQVWITVAKQPAQPAPASLDARGDEAGGARGQQRLARGGGADGVQEGVRLDALVGEAAGARAGRAPRSRPARR